MCAVVCGYDGSMMMGMPSKNRRAKFGIALLGSVLCLAADFAQPEKNPDRSTVGLPERILVVTALPLTPGQERVLHEANSWLIMIPGVSSGDLDENCRFVDQVRIRGQQDVAIFYDWESRNPGRKVVSPTAVDPAAKRLLALFETFQTETARKSLDILAHSAGTVVVNKTAMAIDQKRSPVRFRHVLLLGTALDAYEPLHSLKGASASVLNLHSAHDKVNRNVNDRLGRLSALEGGPYRNLSMDRSLGGRLVRHYVFLASNPENWLQYGTYLAGGKWPQPNPTLSGDAIQPDSLHALTLWVREHPDDSHRKVLEMLPRWIQHPEPEVRYYAVILAGLLQAKSLGPTMKALLEEARTPVYLRKEIYQALGNLKDGAYVDSLRAAYKSDRACTEEIRDVLDALKRERIEALR